MLVGLTYFAEAGIRLRQSDAEIRGGPLCCGSIEMPVVEILILMIIYTFAPTRM